MIADPQRHLLFGLIALQVGLIEQEQLLSSFRAWIRDKNRPLSDHLDNLNDDDRAAVEAMVAVHLRKHGGDAEKSLASIPAGALTRERLAALDDPEVTRTVAHVGVASSGSDEDHTKPREGATSTLDGGRFRVLRPHARGGLGAVFVALDAELKREVALKQILDCYADDPTSRQRFLIEAEITGGLEHPGIVPVYGLGQYPDGRPYYAMRFVRGDSLKEAADAFHADHSLRRKAELGRRMLQQQKLLRRYLDVCDVIDYAHSRGILHRDIKPSNILLGKHGETLVVDWGLAKPIGRSATVVDEGERTLVPSSSGGSSETLPGSAMGTPAYMSPEQAAGDIDHLGPRSDVYSLGATLYYLVAGRAPFEGQPVDILKAAQRGDFAPPRSAAPWVDPALEAICLKAMATHPEGRYPSARNLAADIERWLADEPVSAYQEPARRRLARWERRHKPLVLGAFSTAAIAAVGLAVTVAAVYEQKRTSERAKSRAEEKAQEAEANFTIASTVAYDMSTELSDQRLRRFPGMTSLRQGIAEGALQNFQKLVSMKPGDPSLLLRAARVYSNAGYARASTGNTHGACTAFRDAIQLLDRRERLLGSSVSDEDLKPLADDLATYTIFLLDHHLNAFPTYGFAEYRSRARRRADELLARSPSASVHQVWRQELAGRMDLYDGRFYFEEGDFPRAKIAFERASERLRVGASSSVWFWGLLWHAQAHRGLGLVAHELGDVAMADREFKEALRIIRSQVEAHHDDVDPFYVLGWTQWLNGRRLAADSARGTEAEAALTEARTVVDKLTKDFPAETRYDELRGLVLLEWGRHAAFLGHDEDAERDLGEARQVFAALISRENNNDDAPIHLAAAEVELGALRARQNRAVEAVGLYEAALGRLEAAKRNRPNHREALRLLETARNAHGRARAGLHSK